MRQGDAGRVRVVLERSGGLLGRPIRRGLDSADLPEAAAARLRAMARQAAPPAGGRRIGGRRTEGADRFMYTLEIDYLPEVDSPPEVDRPTGADRPTGDHGRRRRAVRTFSEPPPEELLPLLALLRAAPLLPARGADPAH